LRRTAHRDEIPAAVPVQVGIAADNESPCATRYCPASTGCVDSGTAGVKHCCDQLDRPACAARAITAVATNAPISALAARSATTSTAAKDTDAAATVTTLAPVAAGCRRPATPAFSTTTRIGRIADVAADDGRMLAAFAANLAMATLSQQAHRSRSRQTALRHDLERTAAGTTSPTAATCAPGAAFAAEASRLASAAVLA
jgi:hypothetical protein